MHISLVLVSRCFTRYHYTLVHILDFILHHYLVFLVVWKVPLINLMILWTIYNSTTQKENDDIYIPFKEDLMDEKMFQGWITS
jgi:hypothetical protein